VSILAGVDEAGLGPLLGPLVIGFSAFRVPDEKANLWELLDGAVAREVRSDRERLIVNDSKVVFSRNPRGRRRLEATSLAFLSLLRPGRKPPQDASWMFEKGPAPAPEEIARHPWYAELPERLPLEQEAGSLELRSQGLWRSMGRAGVDLVDAGVRVVPAGELNHSFGETHSKGTTLWIKTSEVLRHLWESFSEEDLLVVADQHGGRRSYGSLLARDFPDASVVFRTFEEGVRGWELERRGRPQAPSMRLLIRPRADLDSFPTALASCLAKYARETCMGAFNTYFGGLQPGLRPTAGYTTDGRRWMDEASGMLARSDLPEGLLARTR